MPLLEFFFHDDYWAGGYVLWQRRMMRLGHISFFGLAFINISYALSVKVYELQVNDAIISWLFIIGAIAMPTVCFLSAYKKPFRHLFFIPVILGGLHVTCLPEEAKEHCDAVLIGEGELHWLDILNDVQSGKLKAFYGSVEEEFDLKDSLMPAFELLDIDKYNRLTIQTSRRLSSFM